MFRLSNSLACAAIAILATILLLVAQPIFADPLKNAMYRQRIGNYDFQVATEPPKLIAGEPAKVMLRIAGVNGDDLVDTPVKLRLVKDGADTATIGPVIIPYGHYVFDRTFDNPGKYVLYVDLTDNAYSGQTLTFTFILNVASPIDFYLYTIAPGIVVAGAAVFGTIFVIGRKRKAKA